MKTQPHLVLEEDLQRIVDQVGGSHGRAQTEELSPRMLAAEIESRDGAYASRAIVHMGELAKDRQGQGGKQGRDGGETPLAQQAVEPNPQR